MKEKQTKVIVALLIAAVIVAGIGGYFLGRSSATEAAQAERELNIQLYRSVLEGLGEIEGPIYVTGHKSPDSDTVGSAIGYAALLCQLGYDAHPAVLGSINRETQFILDTAGLEVPETLYDVSGLNVVLVDHGEYTQSADGLQDAKIISIIDHHGAGAVTTGNQIIYDARPLGATATIIWLRYRNYGLEPDKSTAVAMLGALLSDTKNLQSVSTTFADREALKALRELSGISYTDAFYDRMYREYISHEGMTDEEIFYSDYKEYEAGGTDFSIGCVSVYDEAEAKEMAARMKAYLPAAQASSGMRMSIAQITIFHDDVSVTYLVPSDDFAAQLLESAFGDSVVFDGTSYILTPGISRKQVLVPALTDLLNAYPKE